MERLRKVRHILAVSLLVSSACGSSPTWTPDPGWSLTASDGTQTASVEISWDRIDGATGYRLYRDGEVIADGITAASYVDTGARASKPTAPVLTASQGTYADRVELSWTP